MEVETVVGIFTTTEAIRAVAALASGEYPTRAAQREIEPERARVPEERRSRRGRRENNAIAALRRSRCAEWPRRRRYAPPKARRAPLRAAAYIVRCDLKAEPYSLARTRTSVD
jgi:hypothetical protein